MNMAPTFAHCVWLPAPRGGAAPAARQSRFRGPCLSNTPPHSPLYVVRGLCWPLSLVD